jgi:hypothetical protein
MKLVAMAGPLGLKYELEFDSGMVMLLLVEA